MPHKLVSELQAGDLLGDEEGGVTSEVEEAWQNDDGSWTVSYLPMHQPFTGGGRFTIPEDAPIWVGQGPANTAAILKAMPEDERSAIVNAAIDEAIGGN